MSWRPPPRTKITACCTYSAEGFSQKTAADRHANKQSTKRSHIAACTLAWRTNDTTAGLTNGSASTTADFAIAPDGPVLARPKPPAIA